MHLVDGGRWREMSVLSGVSARTEQKRGSCLSSARSPKKEKDSKTVSTCGCMRTGR